MPGPQDRDYGPKGVHNMIIFTREGGVPVVYRDYRSLDIADPHLVSGFFSALNSFASEALGSDGINSFEVDDLQCMLSKTPYLIGALVVEPGLKNKHKAQHLDRMDQLMYTIWDRYHDVLARGQDISENADPYVDAEMGFHHEAVKAHERQLEEERKTRAILAKMDAIQEEDQRKAEAETYRLNMKNGNYFRQLVRELRDELVARNHIQATT